MTKWSRYAAKILFMLGISFALMASGGSPCSEGDLSPLIFGTQKSMERGPSLSTDGTLVAFAYDMRIYVVDHLGQSLMDPAGQRADHYDDVDFSPLYPLGGKHRLHDTSARARVDLGRSSQSGSCAIFA